MNMQIKLYTILFSSHWPMTSCLASSQAVITEPANFTKLMNFARIAKLTEND